MFSGAYLNSANTSSAQFSDVAITYTPGTDGTNQTIDFPSTADRPFSAAPVNLSATATSGLPVSYTVTSGPATVSGSTLTLAGIGEVTVRANQAGDITWLPALPVEQTFTVSKGLAPVTLSGLSHTYDGSAKSAAATTAPANLSVDIRYNGGQTAPYQIGSYEVTAVIADDNYEGAASGTLVILDVRTGLETWRFEHFQTYEDAGSAANTADPDHDGIQNLMEFALGLDPMLPSTLPATLALSGGQMEYTYTRSHAALASMTFTVELTDSLADGTWTSETVTEITPPLADNGITQTVKVTLPAGSSHRFIRLKVTALP